MITKITDHVDQAVKRLLFQYRDQPNFEAFLRSSIAPDQEIEDVAWDLLTKRWIDTAFGITLDNIGTIVGEERDPGQSDDEYRIDIKARIMMNISQGEPERLISIYSLLVNSDKVFIDDAYNGEVVLMSDVDITQEQANRFIPILQAICGAGIRCAAVGAFEQDDAFSFDGDDGAGFGSVSDLDAGGKLAYLFVKNDIDFAFEDPDPGVDGFGTLGDPFVGGSLVAV